MNNQTNSQEQPDYKLTELEKQVVSLIAELEQDDLNWQHSKKTEGSMERTIRHKKLYARIIKTCRDPLDKLCAVASEKITELQAVVKRQDDALAAVQDAVEIPDSAVITEGEVTIQEFPESSALPVLDHFDTDKPPVGKLVFVDSTVELDSGSEVELHAGMQWDWNTHILSPMLVVDDSPNGTTTEKILAFGIIPCDQHPVAAKLRTENSRLRVALEKASGDPMQQKRDKEAFEAGRAAFRKMLHQRKGGR